MKKEKTLYSNEIFKGKILTLRVDTVMLENGRQSTREIIEHGGAVCIVALNNNNEVLLVKQFRKAIEDSLLEVPAGRLEQDEDPEEAALRELREETGYRAKFLKPIGRFYTTPGFTDEIMYVFLAQGLVPDPLQPDDDEFVEVIKVKKSLMIDMVMTGNIQDGKTIAALYLATKHLRP